MVHHSHGMSLVMTENRRVNLNGEWIGNYRQNFEEVIRINQEGSHLIATKVTGDEYVPAEEVTWRANIETGKGEGQVAEYEFRNPKFVPGELTVVDDSNIVFTWHGVGSVEYRRDD